MSFFQISRLGVTRVVRQVFPLSGDCQCLFTFGECGSVCGFFFGISHLVWHVVSSQFVIDVFLSVTLTLVVPDVVYEALFV